MKLLTENEIYDISMSRSQAVCPISFAKGMTEAQDHLLSQASEGFEEYIDYITSGRRLQVNRLDLHEQTWQAAKLSQAKEIEELKKENEELKKDVKWILSKSRAKSSFCTKTWNEKVAMIYEAHKLGEAK